MAGHIVNRGKNKWLVRIFLGRDENGTRQYHNKTIEGNKKVAQAYVNKVLHERDKGATIIEPCKDTLNKYLDDWLETSAEPRLRERTLKSYKDMLDLYVRPSLGKIKLCDLSPKLVQQEYNKLNGRVSPRTVRYAHSVLRSALNQAVKWEILPKNPVLSVDLPRHQKKEIEVLTSEQSKAFLEASKSSRWYALFSLMLSAGTRPGEALALKWGDIDFNQNRIHVQRGLARIQGGGWYLDETKTAKARVIPLPKQVMEVLRAHKKLQAEEKMKHRDNYIELYSQARFEPEKENGANKKPDKDCYCDFDFVFASENGHPLDERNVVNRHFKPLLKEYKLPSITFYALRHTCATLLLLRGVNPKIVSERLGHASVTMTLDTYSHVLPEMQGQAAMELEEVLYN